MSVFKGVIPPVIARGPLYASLFATHGLAQRAIRPLKLRKYWEQFACGAASGVVTALIETPTDLAKTQLQNSALSRRRSKVDLNQSVK